MNGPDPAAGGTRYRRLSPLTPVVRSFIVVVAAATTIGRDLLRGDVGPTAVTFGLLLLGGGVYGFASWLRTKFWIEADELRVDTGVLSRQSRRIRIDRLQGIDIVQPFVARLFGLAELRMDVAGGSAREGSLAFLPLSEAKRLREVLLLRRDAVRGDPSTSPASTGREPVGERPTDADQAGPGWDRVLATVPIRLLLLSLLISTESVALVVVGAAVVVSLTLASELLGASALLPVLGGIALVQFRKFSANYRFTVSETAAGLQVRRGLFDLNVQTLALARLQGVVVSEPVMWRRLGWARLDVSIAGYGSTGENDGPAPSTVLPVGDRDVVMRLTRHVLDVDPERIRLSPPPPAARWVSPVGRHFMGAGASPEVVVSRDGWLTRRTHVVPHARIQSLRIRQGPWQRRFGLADLVVDSPPGPADARVRHRTAEDIRFILEREIEVCREARAGLSPTKQDRQDRREP